MLRENLAFFSLFGASHIPLGYNCIPYLQALCLLLARDHGKVFRHGISIALGTGVSDGRERWKSKAAREWDFLLGVWCPQGSIFGFSH